MLNHGSKSYIRCIMRQTFVFNRRTVILSKIFSSILWVQLLICYLVIHAAPSDQRPVLESNGAFVATRDNLVAPVHVIQGIIVLDGTMEIRIRTKTGSLIIPKGDLVNIFYCPKADTTYDITEVQAQLRFLKLFTDRYSDLKDSMQDCVSAWEYEGKNIADGFQKAGPVWRATADLQEELELKKLAQSLSTSLTHGQLSSLKSKATQIQKSSVFPQNQKKAADLIKNVDLNLVKLEIATLVKQQRFDDLARKEKELIESTGDNPEIIESLGSAKKAAFAALRSRVSSTNAADLKAIAKSWGIEAADVDALITFFHAELEAKIAEETLKGALDRVQELAASQWFTSKERDLVQQKIASQKALSQGCAAEAVKLALADKNPFRAVDKVKEALSLWQENIQAKTCLDSWQLTLEEFKRLVEAGKEAERNQDFKKAMESYSLANEKCRTEELTRKIQSLYQAIQRSKPAL